jgi:putative ABC transport system permease protein
MTGPAVRALLRLARRDAWRHRGRSVLITLTLTLPVAGLAAAVSLVHALSVPLSAKATWAMGRADALAQVDTSRQHTPAAVHQALAKDLPPGSTTVVFGTGTSRITGPDGLLRTTLVSDLAYADPLAAGMVTQHSGRPPRTAGEADVTPALAGAAHLRLGSRVTVNDVGETVVTVVGIADTPSQLDLQQLWLPSGSLSPTFGGATALVRLAPGTDPTAWAAKAQDLSPTTRASLLHPVHPQESGLASQQSFGLEVLVSGLALLEAVLMAGAAFGVGARRSQRDLALLAATGGDAAQVRGVVLAGAVVLGAVAGIVGTAGGVAIAAALLPEARNLSNHAYVGVHPHPYELLFAFLLGIITALLSAWLPARGAARAPIVASLSGRRGVVRTSPARVGLAVATAALGTLCCAWAGRTHDLGSRQFDAILFFAAVAELGFAGCAPSLVGLAGRLGDRLPFTARLSLRDIARNRSRTGPAVAAIMATLSGVVAMGVYVASEHANRVANFTPMLPPNMAALESSQSPLPSSLVGAVSAALHATSVTGFGDGQGSRSGYVEQTKSDGSAYNSALMVGGRGLLKALGIPGATAALAAGKAVVINGRPLDEGRVRVMVMSSGNQDGVAHEVAAVEAKVGNYDMLGAAVVSTATARSLGVSTTTPYLLWTTPHKPSTDEIAAANAAVLASPDGQSLGLISTEIPLDDAKLLLVPLALLAISTLVTFGVTTISTALSAAESRGDLATLSAVGASQAVRRRLAMGQAGVLALLGGVLGIAAGLVPMAAVIAVRPDVLDFTVPWQVIALALVGVPLVAGGGAGLFTRSRLPLPRRLT